MEKFGVPGMAHPSIGIHHNIEQPKGPHIPLPAHTPSVHSHHTHNGSTHTPVHQMPHGNEHHHSGNHTNHHGHHAHVGHHGHKK